MNFGTWNELRIFRTVADEVTRCIESHESEAVDSNRKKRSIWTTFGDLSKRRFQSAGRRIRRRRYLPVHHALVFSMNAATLRD